MYFYFLTLNEDIHSICPEFRLDYYVIFRAGDTNEFNEDNMDKCHHIEMSSLMNRPQESYFCDFYR